MLKVIDLSYSYHQDEILSHLTFSLEEGKLTVLLGPNGTGKSTLIHLISGLIKCKNGQIYYGNDELKSLSYKKRASLIGYVAQNPHPSSLCVFDTILLGRLSYFGKKANQEDYQIIEELIHDLHLEKFALRPCNELSGGELQLVMIAKALAQNAKVLLLDEPTSSLDIKKQLLILNFVKQLCHKKKITVLMSLHDINLAIQYADNILLLKEKHIIFNDEVNKLSENILQDAYQVKLHISNKQGEKYIYYEKNN